jgi:hypothetical protein
MEPEAERARFAELQARFATSYPKLVADPKAPRTVIVLPSLSLDAEVMARISGVHHYEERMLCMLLLLRLPRTQVVFVTSQPVAESTIGYYLGLLAGVPHHHARARLHLVSCHDASCRPLAVKVLERPRLVDRVAQLIGDRDAAHLSCFTVSPAERTLAVRLGIPIYGCDPDLATLGSKSGSRRLFREAGIRMPDGFEDLPDEQAVAEALAALKARDPGLQRAVVKLNEGFSGEGNAVFGFQGAPEGAGLCAWIADRLPRLAFEAKGMDWEAYRAKLCEMGAVVEAFIEGADKRSPSAQFRIEPDGTLDMVSTHDQVLGGPSGQIFLGCEFPADPAYRLEIQAAGLEAARRLRDHGVLGRFAVDFISARQEASWAHHAIEVNLRKGGTTHPNVILQFLTDGAYHPETGTFVAPTGHTCCYHASDNVEAEAYRGLTPDDLVDLAVLDDLHFDRGRREGVVFHLIGALSEFGKLGMVCVAPTLERARELFRATIDVLDRETGNTRQGDGRA